LLESAHLQYNYTRPVLSLFCFLFLKKEKNFVFCDLGVNSLGKNSIKLNNKKRRFISPFFVDYKKPAEFLSAGAKMRLLNRLSKQEKKR